MNETLQQWLAANVNAPGTLGGGVRLPDGSCICQSLDEQFPPEKIEKILQQLAQAQSQLLEANFSPEWSTWVFEQGKIRSIARADGLLLAIAVRTETDAALNLDKISTEFLALEF
jgi:hypothetical protein